MKTIKNLLILLFFLTGCATGGSISKKTSDMVSIFEKYHYRNLSFNQNDMIRIKKDFISHIDPHGYYLTKMDCDALLSTQVNIKTSRNNNAGSFVNKAAEIITVRLNEVRSIISDLMKKGFNYNLKETISFADEVIYPGNKNELAEKWRKYLKYKILVKFFNKIYVSDSFAKYREVFPAQEPLLRSSVEKNENKIIDNILKYPDGLTALFGKIFLNAVASHYDSHSMYFSASEKKNFEEQLSSRIYSFGIHFKKNVVGEVRISRLIPGGAAWKCAKLNNDDVVLELQLPTAGNKVLSTQELSLSGIYEIINDPSIKQIILTVKKINGPIEKVSLVKEKLINEENIVNSYVLKGNKKVGYIYLPAFYSEWNIPGSPACANDVAKEILKLQREKIDGLILDLRNNSGGSMLEAIMLTGIFIDQGPVFFQSSRGNKTKIIKDPVRGTVYGGPLVVMVNEQSASASEFFVSSMKDYNRAVIVGGTTFGKASSQVLLPMVNDINKITPDMYNDDNQDFVKVTTSIYYNLMSKTHHVKGVSPDVFLPDVFENMNKEGRGDIIKPADINRSVPFDKFPAIPHSMLSSKSRNRISGNKNFQAIKKLNRDIKKYIVDAVNLPLETGEFISDMKRRIDILGSIKNKICPSSNSFQVRNNEFDADIIKMDSYKKGVNDQLIRQIKEDVHISEAFSIMNDYINYLRGY